MDARCSGGAENPPANPLNFKLTHMLGCLRTIIITMVPMITLMMKLPVQTMMKFWFFLHSFSFLFSSYPVCQIVNGYQGRGGTPLQFLQPETLSEIALPFWAAAGFQSGFYFPAWTQHADGTDFTLSLCGSFCCSHFAWARCCTCWLGTECTENCEVTLGELL